jgi:hypothetical protein
MDHPTWVHRLAVVLRFYDVFSLPAQRLIVRAPLVVTTPLPVGVPPNLQIRPPLGVPPVALTGASGAETLWRARRVQSDDTYRLFVTNQALQPGNYPIAVTAPAGEYVNFQPIGVPVPVPRTPPPPPALRSDFIFEFPLWPTRRASIAPGDTALLGRIIHVGGAPAVNYRVTFYPPPGPPPAMPYTRSDANGDFVYRFPSLKRAPPPAPPVALHGFEVRDAANAVVVPLQPPPNSVGVTVGQITTGVQITVP